MPIRKKLTFYNENDDKKLANVQRASSYDGFKCSPSYLLSCSSEVKTNRRKQYISEPNAVIMTKINRLQDCQDEINPELLRERKNCPFDQEEITNLLDGDKTKTEERRNLEDIYLSKKELLDDGTLLETLSAEERYDYDVKTSLNLFKLIQNEGGNDGSINYIKSMFGSNAGSIVTPDGSPIGLHYVMFIPTIFGQGTAEQQAEWLGKAWNMEIIGTYAQTEMGHGTFLRGLETTATFDPTTQEFVLNSPTITAYKWWPGGLGKTANHAIVMAQLVTKGEKKGPHAFVVQLRDLDTHEPLPGITVGEIGPKLGMGSNDNGYLAFSNHRISRDRMLMKTAQVLEDGTYVKPPQDKLSYGTMVFVRCAIVSDVAGHLKKAATIAVRYSAVRRQSEMRPGEPEPQIMDYQTQQFKLFPSIAMYFAFTFASQRLWNYYETNLAKLEDGDFDLLPELHALSCGLKALTTQEVADMIDVLRRSCGGHGFMASSNFPRLWGLVTAACTYEGENTVMQLQVGRYLAKCFLRVKEGKELPISVAYLQDSLDKPHFTQDVIEMYTSLFKKTAKGQLSKAMDNLERLERQTKDKADAWNANSVLICQAAMAHVRCYIISEFGITLKQTPMSAEVNKVITNNFELISIYWMLKNVGDFIQYANLEKNQVSSLENRMTQLLSDIRPVAVSLVDAFDVPDASLKSTLGAYDGQVYKRLLNAAQASPLNKTNVLPAFNKYIKPFLQSQL